MCCGAAAGMAHALSSAVVGGTELVSHRALAGDVVAHDAVGSEAFGEAVCFCAHQFGGRGKVEDVAVGRGGVVGVAEAEKIVGDGLGCGVDVELCLAAVARMWKADCDGRRCRAR